MSRHKLSAAACTLFFAPYMFGQAAAGQGALPVATHGVTQVTTLSVTANLVTVPVTVRDNKDHLLRTLTRDDFTLSVDGHPQVIRYFDREDDVPLTLGLLVDVSASQLTVLDNERTASSAFLDDMLQPGRDAAFIVQFGRSADMLADITPSLPKLQAALKKIEGAEIRPAFNNGGGNEPTNPGTQTDPRDNPSDDSRGNGGGDRGGRQGDCGGLTGLGTVLYDAVFLSSDEVLQKVPAKSANRKALVLLTDGDDHGSKESLAASIEAAQRADATIYAIYYRGAQQRGAPGVGGLGFPGGRGRGGFPGGGGGGGGRVAQRNDGKKVLERMAEETGGRVFVVSRKETLTVIYAKIAEELRSQYRLGFTPSNTDDGYHRIAVDVPKQKKPILQTRNGYYTGAAAK